jgi:hypothetical protein
MLVLYNAMQVSKYPENKMKKAYKIGRGEQNVQLLIKILQSIISQNLQVHKTLQNFVSPFLFIKRKQNGLNKVLEYIKTSIELQFP